MAWVCGRRATEDDYEKLENTAQRFIKRHDLQEIVDRTAGPEEITGFSSDYGKLSFYLWPMDEFDYDVIYLTKLWKQCFRRAIKDVSATGIGWGYIGYEDNL